MTKKKRKPSTTQRVLIPLRHPSISTETSHNIGNPTTPVLLYLGDAEYANNTDTISVMNTPPRVHNLSTHASTEFVVTGEVEENPIPSHTTAWAPLSPLLNLFKIITILMISYLYLVELITPNKWAIMP